MSNKKLLWRSIGVGHLLLSARHPFHVKTIDYKIQASPRRQHWITEDHSFQISIHQSAMHIFLRETDMPMFHKGRNMKSTDITQEKKSSCTSKKS